MSSADGWETIHTKRKSRAEKKAEKAKAKAQTEDNVNSAFANYGGFLNDDLTTNKRKPFANQTPFNPNSATNNKSAEANNKKLKAANNKAKSKVTATGPEGIDKAIADITVDDIRNGIKSAIAGEPNNPLVWLTSVANLFNLKVAGNVKQLVTQNKSFDYPAKLFKKDVVQELNQLFAKCSNQSLNEFQRLTIQHTIPSTLNRHDEHTSFGFVLVLQLWTLQQKQVSPRNVQLLAQLRTKSQLALTYQVQLWTISRVGYLDLQQGLLIWRSLYYPIWNTKPFGSLAFDYLKDIVSRHTPNKGKVNNEIVSGTDLCYLLNQIRSPSNAKNSVQLQKLKEIYSTLKNLAITNVSLQVANKLFFDLLSNLTAELDEEIVPLMIQCLRQEPKLFEAWKKSYTSTMVQSNLVVDYISRNFKTSKVEGLNKKAFQNVLQAFQKSNKTDQPHNQKMLLKEMSSRNSHFCRNFVLLSLFTLFVYYDVTRNNGLARSNTGKFLQDIGALRSVQTLIVKARPYNNWLAAQYKTYLTPIDPQIQAGIQAFDSTLDTVVAKTEFYTRDYRKNFVKFAAFYLKKLQNLSKPLLNNLFDIFSSLENKIRTNVFGGTYSVDNLKIAFEGFWLKSSDYLKQTSDWANKQIQSLF